LVGLTAAMVLCWGPRQSWAHTVNVFAYIDGDRIVVEGYFGRKVRAANCAVAVHDAHGNKIGEGKTDDKGVYVLKLTEAAFARGDLKVILDAGQGHKGEYTLKAMDRAASTGGPRQETSGTTAAQATSEQTSLDVSERTSPVSPQQVAMLVNQALDEKMAPVLQMLRQQQSLLMEQNRGGPGLREVIGGIGWIFGLVGVAAYFMSRRRSG